MTRIHRTHRIARPLAAASALAFAAVAAAPAGADELVYGTHVPSTHSTADTIILPWIDAVKEATGGEYEITMQWGGAVAKNAAIPGAIRDGLIDMGLMPDVYSPGEFPSSVVITSIALPGTDIRVMTGVASEARLLNCPGCVEEFAETDTVLISSSAIAPQYLMCKEPVTSLADLSGKKVRASGAPARVMAALGATPVALQFTDTYEAMERGQVDCTTGVETFMKDYNWWDSGKYVLELPLGTYHGVLILMNKYKYEDMAPETREAFDATLAGMTADYAFVYTEETELARKLAVEEHGVTYVAPNQDILDAIEAFKVEELKAAVETGEKRGAVNPQGLADLTLDLIEKWTAIVAEEGGDRAGFTAALQREVYDKVER